MGGGGHPRAGSRGGQGRPRTAPIGCRTRASRAHPPRARSTSRSRRCATERGDPRAANAQLSSVGGARNGRNSYAPRPRDCSAQLTPSCRRIWAGATDNAHVSRSDRAVRESCLADLLTDNYSGGWQLDPEGDPSSPRSPPTGPIASAMCGRCQPQAALHPRVAFGSSEPGSIHLVELSRSADGGLRAAAPVVATVTSPDGRGLPTEPDLAAARLNLTAWAPGEESLAEAAHRPARPSVRGRRPAERDPATAANGRSSGRRDHGVRSTASSVSGSPRLDQERSRSRRRAGRGGHLAPMGATGGRAAPRPRRRRAFGSRLTEARGCAARGWSSRSRGDAPARTAR